MALYRTAASSLMKRLPKDNNMFAASIRFYSDDPPLIRIDHCPGREQIGFGVEGDKMYYDRYDFPCPAVRYKRETPEIKSLREKEKGSWGKLTIDEKKQLYRASFRLTFAEIDPPTGRWKSHLGWAMLWWAVSLWGFMAFYWAKNRNTMRPSLSYEARQAQLQRLIAIKHEPIVGIASKWDYEKDEWKKK